MRKAAVLAACFACGGGGATGTVPVVDASNQGNTDSAASPDSTGGPVETGLPCPACSSNEGGGASKDAANDAPLDATGSDGADGPPCSGESACRLFSNYCGGCKCDGLGASEPDPTCDGGMFSCFSDPCHDHAAICDAVGRCGVQ